MLNMHHSALEDSMPYEIFTRKVRKLGTPAVTVTKLGRMALNKAATTPFEKQAVENILLMWDGERRQFAIKPIKEKDARSYTLSYGARGNGAGFSAKTFFDFIGLDYSESRMMPAEWNEQDQMFEVKVPDTFFVHRRPQATPIKTDKRQAKRS
jgi:hypothetical protein